MPKKINTVSSAHQRIDDHEKLCRIMQRETNSKINEVKKSIIRLEKFGLLTPQKRELLIDKLTSIGFEPMDIEVVKALSILMLFQEPSVEVKLHAYDGEEAFDKPKTLN